MISLDRMFFVFPLPEDRLRNVFEYSRRFAKQGHGKVQPLVFGFQLCPPDAPIILVVPERDHHTMGEV